MGHVRLVAVEESGPRALPVPEGVEDIHQLDFPDGIYEGLRTFDHDRFLYLERHLDRIEGSMELVGWSQRLDRPALRRALHAEVSAFPHDNARIRFDILEHPPADLPTDARVLLALAPHAPLPSSVLEDGVRVGVERTKRRDTPHIKFNRWIIARRGSGPGDRGFFEHLLVDEEERILEGSTCNIFTVRDGTLITTPGGVLPGLTRRVFLELAEEARIPVRLEATPLAEVEGLDEMFLTSSTRAAVPIVAVEERRVGDGRPGPIHRRLMEGYHALVRREARPALGETSP